jgi:signal transduction histidine kinase
MLLLLIKDNGIGFDINHARNKQGKGINNIKHRVTLLNGQFSISTQFQSGCEVFLKIPVAQP